MSRRNALAYFGAALVAKKLSNTDNRTKKLGWLSMREKSNSMSVTIKYFTVVNYDRKLVRLLSKVLLV